MFSDDALRLYDKGWLCLTPIKARDKRPEKSGWPEIGKRAPSRADIAGDAKHYPHSGIGLVYGPANQTIAIDIDILDAPLANAARDVCESILGCTPLVRQGLPPKLLLLYRKALPFEIAGKFFGAFEVFSRAGSQTVIAGVHPDTGRPYEWIAGASPIDTTPDGLPSVTPEQVYAAIDALGDLIQRANYNPPEKPYSAPETRKVLSAHKHQQPHQPSSQRQRGASDRTSGAMASVIPKLRGAEDPLLEASRLAATANYGSRYGTAFGLIGGLVAMGYDDDCIERAVIGPYLNHFGTNERRARANAIETALIWARSNIGADDHFKNDGACIVSSLAAGW